MNIGTCNWMQVERYLAHDDRAVVPLGSTEQHAYLSLSVDSILSERVATEAAEPLGVPVFPALNYGLTPYFMAYPGTVTLRVATYQAILGDILDSLSRTGFKRVLFVNGHGGNNPGSSAATEWMLDNPGVRVKWHNWWNAPKTWAKVQEIDPQGSHASWMENFAWTRVSGRDWPTGAKPMIDSDRMRVLPPAEVRELIGDGNLGGAYAKSDAIMEELWRVGVEETRATLEGPWQ
ncbi:MAG TPA: creatininase family protein [Trueperaceae bacterium]